MAGQERGRRAIACHHRSPSQHSTAHRSVSVSFGCSLCCSVSSSSAKARSGQDQTSHAHRRNPLWAQNPHLATGLAHNPAFAAISRGACPGFAAIPARMANLQISEIFFYPLSHQCLRSDAGPSGGHSGHIHVDNHYRLPRLRADELIGRVTQSPTT